MSSTVLLVDSEREVRAIIERQLDPAHRTLVQASDSEQALQLIKDQQPALVVVNVDIAKGWPLCTQLKRSHTAIPVIVVSFRLGKDVFNNHQKLDTRADAYHRLPEELEGLEISLGYFSSHKSETGHDDEDSSPSRPRLRASRALQVPSGVLQRLESTVAEQARALEDARRQIEALEVERDAVADKNRRQMLELMTVSPGPASEGGADSGILKERIASLEAEVFLSSRRDDELRELRAAVAAKSAELEKAVAERTVQESALKMATMQLEEMRHADGHARQALEAQVMAMHADKAQMAQRLSELEEAARNTPTQQVSAAAAESREAARREAAEAADQLGRASVQLSTLASELSQAHQARLQAEAEKRQIEDQMAQAIQRAESAETAWSVVNGRLGDLQSAIETKASESEQLVIEKKSVEQALATSRRLMREYATDAARKAEELKTASERLRELELLTSGFEATREELTQALDFEKSLVESLEKDLAEARARAPESDLEAVHAAEREALASHVATVHSRFEAVVTYARALEAQLVAAEGRRGALEARLEELLTEVRGQALSGEIPPPMDLPQAPTAASPATTD